MREAMAHAEVGDDVFGEDPTVRALEERVAGLLGHEAGLFSPTGSLANQLGVRLHVSPGQELVADQQAHVLRAELGAAAAFSGITSRSWPSERGLLDPAGPMSLVTTGVGPYQVETALVVLENTHNFGGGTVQPIEAIREVRRATQAVGVAMHLDGARLWNAHVASGVALADYGSQFDTVSVCLSKGLGAPVGSVLVGSAERWPRRASGASATAPACVRSASSRPPVCTRSTTTSSGSPTTTRARPGSPPRAPRRHRQPSTRPPSRPTSSCSTSVQSVGPHRSSSTALLEQGVRTYAVGPGRVRAVWHLDVDDAGTDAAVDAATGLLRSRAA